MTFAKKLPRSARSAARACPKLSPLDRFNQEMGQGEIDERRFNPRDLDLVSSHPIQASPRSGEDLVKVASNLACSEQEPALMLSECPTLTTLWSLPALLTALIGTDPPVSPYPALS